jgi:hypothetical protein
MCVHCDQDSAERAKEEAHVAAELNASSDDNVSESEEETPEVEEIPWSPVAAISGECEQYWGM